MTTEEPEHESSKTPEAPRFAEGPQAVGVPEGFPNRECSGILVHDSNDSTCGSGDGMAASDLIPVIDLFAGPGGLGEGFSAARHRGRRAFRIALSVEKDPDAHATLMLRSFFRQFAGRRVPEAYYEHLRGELTRDDLYARYPAEAQLASQEAWHHRLRYLWSKPLSNGVDDTGRA